jgi:hypothetical protein
VAAAFTLSAEFAVRFPWTGRGFGDVVAATQPCGGAILACSSTLYTRGPTELERRGRGRKTVDSLVAFALRQAERGDLTSSHASNHENRTHRARRTDRRG